MKKQSLKIVVLILGIFSFYNYLHAEYIVYKQNGESAPITDPNEYSKIYDILMNFQWPMLIGNASKLSPAELQEIIAPNGNAEENFLRKKLKALSATYEIAYIPTILYELFAIAQVNNKTIPELEELNKFMVKNKDYSIDQNIVKSLINNSNTTMQAWYDLFKKTNTLAVSINAHRALNTVMIEFIKKADPSNKDLKNIIQKEHKSLIQSIMAANHFEPDSPLNYLNTPSTLETFINFENEIRNKNAGVLYRGGFPKKTYVVGRPISATQSQEPIDISFLTELGKPDLTFNELKQLYQKKEKSITFTPWKLGKPLGSVSYGNSLLAGFINDKEACAGYYFSLEKKLGYALSINKRQILFENLKSLFNYSLFNTLISLLAAGEFFHSRTVSYVSQPVPLTMIPGIGLPTVLPFDRAGILLRIGDPIQIAYELSDYIGQNAQIIKLPDGTFNLFAQTTPQVAPYYQAQKEVTQMFQAMSILKKRLNKYTALQLALKKQINDEITKTLAANTPEALENFKKYLNSNPTILQQAEQELITASIENNIKIVETFLKAGINPNAERSGITALMGASGSENDAVVDLLIKAGADVNKLNSEEDTALSLALSVENYELTEKLLKAGADPNILIEKINITALDIATAMELENFDLSKKFQELLARYNAKSGVQVLPSISIQTIDNKTGRIITLIQDPYLNVQLSNVGNNRFEPPLNIGLKPDASKEKYSTSLIFRDEIKKDDLLMLEISKIYPKSNAPDTKKIITDIKMTQIIPPIPPDKISGKKEIKMYSKEASVKSKEDISTKVSFILEGNDLEKSSFDVQETVQ